MRKRTLTLLAICVVAIVLASLFIWDWARPPQGTESITRNVDTPQEETALSTAENLNYSAITNSSRFDGPSDPEAYLQPGTYLSYTYANIVDTGVINYYQTRYDDQMAKGYQMRGDKPKGIEFTYQGSVQNFSEFRIYNSPPPQGKMWYNTTVFMSAPDSSMQKIDPTHFQIYFKNQSSYQTTDRGYDFNFTDCYVVEMKLSYSEYYAPLAGYGTDIYQIVILDLRFEPQLICLSSGGYIS